MEIEDDSGRVLSTVRRPNCRTVTGPGCPIADRLPEHSGPAHSVDELPWPSVLLIPVRPARF